MFGNAVKNVLRAWKKSLLFWLLIVLIALFFVCGLSLAVGMKRYSDEAYASYRTIGLFEYVGDAYPDEGEYSENAADAAEQLSALHLENDPRVEQWDVPVRAIGYNAAIVRVDNEIPYYDHAVLLVHTGASKTEQLFYHVTVEKALFSVRKIEGRRVRLDPLDLPVELNRWYLINGFFVFEGASIPIFIPQAYRTPAAEAAGFDGDLEQMMIDVTTPDGGYAIPEDCPLYNVAESFRVLTDGLELTYTADVESLLPFEQETLYLTDGRYFTAEEYEQGAPVCIVTEWVAYRLGVGVGDTVSFSIVSDPKCASPVCYWHGTGFDAEKTYTVVGITNENQEHLHEVFVPKSADTPKTGNFTYTLGIARLDNDGAEAFAAEITPKLPDNVRLQIYDQGWNTVSAPLHSVRKTVAWLSALSAVAMLALAAVFGFLFVYSDRRSAQIMTRLGTNTPKVYGHYLIGAGLIAVTAAALGVVLSAVFLPKIVAATDRALTSTVTDHTLDYSNAALSFARPLKPLQPPGTGLLLLGGGIAVLLPVLSCTLFAYAAMKKPMQRREAVRHRSHKGKSASLTGGPIRYAALSAVRGGARSFAPLVVILLCTVMLLGLAATRDSYVDQLASIRENTKIKGVYTDLSGRRTHNLLIDAQLINKLYRSGLVEDISVSARGYAAYIGRVILHDNEDEIVTGREDLTAYYNGIVSAEYLVYSDNMLRHPIFGTSAPAVRWLDGYDDSIFASDTIETITRMMPAGPYAPPPKGASEAVLPAFVEKTELLPPMVVPEQYLELYGLELGDVVALQVFRTDLSGFNVKYRIVGSYHGTTDVHHLFCPLVYFLSQDELYGENGNARALDSHTFESAQFTLKNSADLPALKAFFLESGYSEVRQIRKYRTFVVLNDSSFLYTTAQLEKRIATIPSFYPLAVCVGAAIAFIMVFLRRKEVVTMKRLGTNRLRAWLNLWLEQLLLLAAGVVLALSGFLLIRRALSPEGLQWLLILSVGYLLGAGFSAALVCFTKRSSRSGEV